MKIRPPFIDRAAAAQALAARLENYRGRNPLVLAIPRGGVVLGKILAERLQGELDVVLARKIGAPFDPEYAIGAIDETGMLHLQPYAAQSGADGAFIESERTRQLATLQQRRAEYTPYRAPIDPAARIAIVVDDGLATGATMTAALRAVRAKKPAELVCAIPVAAPDSLKRIKLLADRTVCLYAPRDFVGVSQFYRDFPQIEDCDITDMLSSGGNPVNAAASLP